MLSSFCSAEENAFYMFRIHSPDRMSTAEESLRRLNQHYQNINILIPQSYQIDQTGLFYGQVDPEILDFTKTHPVKLMILVTNKDFDSHLVHVFLKNHSAQKKAIQSLVDTCLKNKFYGAQLDFEMVQLADRDGLTQFYLNAARALHQNGLVISYAIAPVVDDKPSSSEFLKRIYKNWEGAYNLKALANSADFMTIMAYNQHGGGTPPGSTASLPWVEKTIQYTMQFIKPEKISLGIPAFSNYWFIGTNEKTGRLSTRMDGISYAKLQAILQKNHAQLVWSPSDKVNYAIYQNNWLNEYLFAEDAQSFNAKWDLVKKYHLRGISVFDLGTEDPKIWDVLQNSA